MSPPISDPAPDSADAAHSMSTEELVAQTHAMVQRLRALLETMDTARHLHDMSCSMQHRPLGAAATVADTALPAEQEHVFTPLSVYIRP